MTGQCNRKEMLHWVDVVSFACLDAALYLDTHPEDEDGLNYYQEYAKLRSQAVKEYSRNVTPLNWDSITCAEDYWKWVHDPWPWQEGGC